MADVNAHFSMEEVKAAIVDEPVPTIEVNKSEPTMKDAFTAASGNDCGIVSEDSKASIMQGGLDTITEGIEDSAPPSFLTFPAELRQPILRQALQKALDKDLTDKKSATSRIKIPRRFNRMLKNLASVYKVAIIYDLLDIVAKMKKEIVKLEPDPVSVYWLFAKRPEDFDLDEWQTVAYYAKMIDLTALKVLNRAAEVVVALLDHGIRYQALNQASFVHNGMQFVPMTMGSTAMPVTTINGVHYTHVNPPAQALLWLGKRQKMLVVREALLDEIERRTPIVNAIKYFTEGNTPRHRLRKVLRFSIFRIQKFKANNSIELRRFQPSQHAHTPRYPMKNDSPIEGVSQRYKGTYTKFED